MAVTKRTRFEVLRRDEHTCQYCGGKAPEVVLTIDHVMPVALGGDDKPGNLVTACKDCNAGKASVTPDSPLVEGLSDRAAAYALGMQDKMTRFRADFEAFEEYEAEFLTLWKRTKSSSYGEAQLPVDYQRSLFQWMRIGVPMAAFGIGIGAALNKYGLRGATGEFTYMAGVINRMMNDREIDLTVRSENVKVYTEAEMDEIRVDAYETGSQESWTRLYNSMADWGRLPRQDFLRAHIDGTSTVFIDAFREGGKVPWRENTLKSELISGTTTTFGS